MRLPENPYATPRAQARGAGGRSIRIVWMIASMAATAGVLLVTWCGSAVGLWMFVIGDSRDFGMLYWYALLIAAFPAFIAGRWLWRCARERRHLPIISILVLTLPGFYWFFTSLLGLKHEMF